jgi:hypothetical protein
MPKKRVRGELSEYPKRRASRGGGTSDQKDERERRERAKSREQALKSYDEAEKHGSHRWSEQDNFILGQAGLKFGHAGPGRA